MTETTETTKKAYLEIDMPEMCLNCPLCFRIGGQIICIPVKTIMHDHKGNVRHDTCPLKHLEGIIQEDEYVVAKNDWDEVWNRAERLEKENKQWEAENNLMEKRMAWLCKRLEGKVPFFSMKSLCTAEVWALLAENAIECAAKEGYNND